MTPRFSGSKPNDALRLKTLYQENARLNRVLAERDLEVDALKTFLEKVEMLQQGILSGGALLSRTRRESSEPFPTRPRHSPK